MVKNNSVSNNVILEAIDITRSIQSDGETRQIVQPFSFKFNQGKIYSLVGPSGAGKSSFLRLLNRLDEKTEGWLLFHNQPAEDYQVTELRRKISLVFQIPHLFSGTVAGNLYYCCPDPKVVDNEEVGTFLSMVGLDPAFADRDPEKLSVGQKQRVAFARSLVQQPEILLLDEPTSALDPGAAKIIEELIIKLNKELKLTIIMVTHNFEQAVRLAEISLVLVDGKLIEAGKSQELFRNPQSDVTRRFINGDLR